MIISRNIFPFIVLVLSLVLTSSLTAQVQEHIIYQKVKVHLSGRDLRDLARLGVEVEHGYKRQEDVLINFFTEEEVKSVREAGFKVDILQEDAVAHYLEESKKVKPVDLQLAVRNPKCEPDGKVYDVPQNFKYGSMGSYLTYEELISELDLMHQKFPHLITERNWFPNLKTKGGNFVYYVKISDNPNDDEGDVENQMLFTALHHAREPMSMMQLVYFMWYILEKYDTDPEIRYLVNKSEMIFVPCVNPDGYIYNQMTHPSGGGLWRKNRNNTNGPGGVDLNRNYSVGFAFDNEGSSPIYSSDTYRGAYQLSEMETKTIHTLRLNNQFKMAINYHSYANVLIYPWGYLEQNTKDKLSYFYFSQDLTQFSDYSYGLNSETLGYPINGSADDYLYQNGILAFTFECGGPELTDEESFWPLQNKIQPICADMLYQNIRALWLLNEGIQYQLTSDKIIRPGNNTVKFLFTKTGLSDDPVKISVSPLTNNIDNFNKTITLNLNHLEKQEIEIPINAHNNTTGPVALEISSIYNGSYIKRDTINLRLYNYQVLYENNGDDLSDFIKQNTDENWTLDVVDYYDTFASISVTNKTTYDKAENKILELKYPVNLPENDSLAFFSYFAKWSIEKNIDHLKTYISTDGVYWDAICGNFSQAGNIDQGEEEPVLDGFQPEWVNAIYNISDYIGKTVYFKLVFRSDAKVNREGIRVDKLQILSVPGGKVSNHKTEALAIQVFPNPTSNDLYISGIGQQKAVFSLLDAQGKILRKEVISNGTNQIDVSNLTSGLYIYQILNENGIVIQTGKTVIAK